MSHDISTYLPMSHHSPLGDTIYLLSLIVLGEVKVDLSNIDGKFWTKYLCIRFFQEILIPAEMSSESFWTSDMTSKTDVLMYLFLSEFRQYRHPANNPPSNSVLLLLQTTGGHRSPARLWSAAQHRPVRILISFCSQAVQSVGVGRFSVGPAL